MTNTELTQAVADARPFSTGAVVLRDGRVVRGIHPRVAVEQNPEALLAGCDDEVLIMTVPFDPAKIYRISIPEVVRVVVI